jgi:thiamine pyrophosphate-dependent acetolactate synthase large subunit-like protein
MAREKQNVTTVICKNRSYSILRWELERAKMTLGEASLSLTGLDKPFFDFVKLAEAYGAKGYNLKRAADIRKILTKALEHKGGPVLINAEVTKTSNVFPMIPAGAALEDMLIEPPKIKLAKPTGST